MFGKQACRGKKITIPDYKGCNRFMYQIDKEVIMETV